MSAAYQSSRKGNEQAGRPGPCRIFDKTWFECIRQDSAVGLHGNVMTEARCFELWLI